MLEPPGGLGGFSVRGGDGGWLLLGLGPLKLSWGGGVQGWISSSRDGNGFSHYCITMQGA